VAGRLRSGDAAMMRSKADADDKDWERQDAFLWLR
jgi:hypothetical protein